MCALIYSMIFVKLASLGCDPSIAGAISYASSMPVAFLLHKKFSFRSAGTGKEEAARFIVASGVGMVVASALPKALTAWLGISANITALLTSIVTPVITYAALSRWVFAKND